MDKLQFLHTTLYSSATSECGKYFVVGNNFGHISIFNISKIMSANVNENKPIFTFQAQSGPVYCILITRELLISCGSGPINVWKWSDLIERKVSKLLCLKSENANEICDSVNSICISKKGSHIFAGGDSNDLYTWDLKTGKCLDVFKGHDDYIHCVDCTESFVATSSEDGLVKLWDTRSAQCSNSIEPNKRKKLKRSEIGKWIASVCVDPNSDWLVCGGGPKTSLWHLRSMSMVSCLDSAHSSKTSDFSANVIALYEDEIVIGGNQPFLHRWNRNGIHKASIPCDIMNIFSLSFTADGSGSKKLPLLATGCGGYIGVFTNLGYQGTKLSLI